MADNSIVRGLKHIANTIIDVSLKAMIPTIAAALAGAATLLWLAVRNSPHSSWFYAIAGALLAILVVILILALLVCLHPHIDEFKTPKGRLRIKKAEYSAPDKAGVEVTEILKRLISEDDRLVLGNVIYNDMFPDASKGVRKVLRIDFSHGLEDFSITVPENTKITLPFPYDNPFRKETA